MSGSPSPWTAADPGGGFADQDWLGVPWLWVVLSIVLVAIAQAIVRVRRGGSLLPSLRRDPGLPAEPIKWRQFWAFWIVFAVGRALIGVYGLDHSLITHGEAIAPGPQVSDAQAYGGVWRDDDDPSGFGIGLGPQYVYRLGPGDSFSYVVSIRNRWPIPVTLLGLEGDSREGGVIPAGGFGVTGLGLLHDPAVPGNPANVDAFRPVGIGPGEEVRIVIAASAGRCADPTADVPKDPPDSYTFNRPLPFVYDLFGWRRVASVAFPLEVTLPQRPVCDLVTTTPG